MFEVPIATQQHEMMVQSILSRVLIITPKQSSWWQGRVSFSGETKTPNSSNKEFMHRKEDSETEGDSAL